MLRIINANGARFFRLFIFTYWARIILWILYIYTYLNSRSYYFIYSYSYCFLGYVLPWGQISFWGTTVITNLFSAIPFIGENLVQWIWGGFAVDSPTLIRFFSLHFMFPFLIAEVSIVHLLFLTKLEEVIL